MPANDRFYEYDAIGNRSEIEESDSPTVVTEYFANEANQYHRTARNSTPFVAQGFRYDEDGNLIDAYISADMNCDGVIGFGDINPFILATANRSAYEAQYPNCNWLNGDVNGDNTVNSGDINAFIELSGTNGSGLRAYYVWDAENRLIEAGPTPWTEMDGDLRTQFVYDYLGRRVEKIVQIWDTDDWVTTPVVHRRFLYHGWLPLMEFDVVAGNNVVLRSYTWGLDASGTLQGLAGVGGLLAVRQEQTGGGAGSGGLDAGSYVYFYDESGNVGQVVDLNAATAAASLVAHYEYGPFGQVTLAAGGYAEANPFRFSTKYYDAETGLSDFGRRYYHAVLGRWLSRDPIGELGGANVYAYVGNNPLNRVDYLGLNACSANDPWCQGTDRDPDNGGGGPPNDAKPPCAKDPGCGDKEEPDIPSIFGRLDWGMTPEEFAYPPPSRPKPYRKPHKKPYPPCPPGESRPALGAGQQGRCRKPNDPHAATNGCSAVPDNPHDYNFKPACDEHDRCYYTPGKSKEQCDSEFLSDLLRICAGYSASERAQCFRDAHEYYWGVRHLAGPWFPWHKDDPPYTPPSEPIELPCGPHY